jgi:integrating conjugative element protein (TIGR03761 family)
MENTFDDEKPTEQLKPASTPPRALGEQPGGLRSSTRMTIQTRQAQKLVLGRRRSKDIQPIIGLLDFGRRMKLLWLSAQADDPYADWYLLQIEESINEAKKVMVDKRQWLDEVLSSMDGFEIDVAQSIEPIQVPIVFQNPYGYMGAYLIADYDKLCCSVFTAGHIGLIDRKTAHRLTEMAGKAVRRTFNLAAKWKFTGVTRQDIKDSNPSAENAIETHGKCPEPIIAKTKRAKISPEIRENKKPVIVTKKSSKKGKDNVEQIKLAEAEVGPKKLFGVG